MSAVTHILTSRARIQRPTSFLLDSRAVAGLTTLDRQPAQAVRLEVGLDGCTVLGNASITFTGSPSSETLALSGNRLKRGKVDMTSVTGVSLSLVSDGFISVRAVDSMGQFVNQLVEKSASLEVRFYVNSGRIRLQKPGDVDVGNFEMMAEPTADVISGDIVTVLREYEVGKVGRVVDVDRIYNFLGELHHIEAKLATIQ